MAERSNHARSTGWRRAGPAPLALALALLLAGPGLAQTPRPSRAQVQAVVLTKVLLFTDVARLRGIALPESPADATADTGVPG